MPSGIEKDLLLNFTDFLESARDELKKGRYNPAVSSYFKALAVLCDWRIYSEKRILPKNHTERFMILKSDFQDAYDLISPLFKKYRDSYSLRMRKEDALELDKNVQKLKRILAAEE